MSEWSSQVDRASEADAADAQVDVVVDAEVELDDVDDILVLDEVTAPTLPVWEPTGDPAVDAALEELSRLDEFERSEQIAVFESVHRRLHERLSDLAAGS